MLLRKWVQTTIKSIIAFGVYIACRSVDGASLDIVSCLNPYYAFLCLYTCRFVQICTCVRVHVCVRVYGYMCLNVVEWVVFLRQLNGGRVIYCGARGTVRECKICLGTHYRQQSRGCHALFSQHIQLLLQLLLYATAAAALAAAACHSCCYYCCGCCCCCM